MKIIISVTIAVIIASCSVQKDLHLYKQSVEYITNSESAKRLIDRKKHMVLYVSPELISINPTGVESDIIKQEYLPNYNIFQELSPSERQIQAKVLDSLYAQGNLYGNLYNKKKAFSIRRLSTKGEHNFILFFSQQHDGFIYAELGGFNDQLFMDKKRETVMYGLALTYLFKFDKNLTRIEKVYEGELHYN